MDILSGIFQTKDAIVNYFIGSMVPYAILVCIIVGVISIILTYFYFFGKKSEDKGEKTAPRFLPPTEFFKPKPRFRKRDKVRFYTTKMLRKVKQFKEDVLPGPEELTESKSVLRKRRRTGGFQRFLQRQDSEIKRMLKEPPASMLEADYEEIASNDSMLPSEVMFMLRSVRVFGHFEKPLFFELCKHIVTKSLPKGKILFRPGVMEEVIYIVQTGQINLYLVDKKGTEMLLKEVKPGENIHSVMNILDAIRGNTTYKYAILMRAAVDTTVLMLPSRAFKRIFEDNPESLVRVVQIVMLRLQQVTFNALHQFLGLSNELISNVMSRKVNEELKSLSVYSLGGASSSSSSTTKAATDDRSRVNIPSSNSTSSNKKRVENSITSIQEVVQESDVPVGSSSPTTEDTTTKRRTSSFTFSNDEVADSIDGKEGSGIGDGKPNSNTTASAIKRTGSHGKLVNLYGSSTMSINTDFEAVLGRVGMDINEAGKISHGNFDDDMLTFDAQTKNAPPLFDGDVDYGGLSKEQEEAMLAAVRSDLVKLLHLPTPKLLDNILSIDVVPEGRFLTRQGDTDSSLVFLVKGSLQIRQMNKAANKEMNLFYCVPGEFVGSLSLLTGEPSFFSVKAIELSYVVIISKLNFYKLIQEHPKIVLPVANSMIQKLSSFVRNIDFALDWTMLEAGKLLFSQNGDPDSVYIVLNGRLRAVQTDESGKKILGDEYGRGEFVGLVDVLTRYPRTNSVHAVRDTELAQLPKGLLNAIKLHYPQVVSRLMQLLGDRILGMKKKGEPNVILNSKLERVGHNLCTVAVFPASNSVPLHNFTFELGLAINDIGPAVILTSDIITKRFGNFVWDSVHEYVLSNWLGYQEDTHRIVLYQCDSYMSEWTKRCVRQADIILIVGCGDQDPAVGKLESQLENMTSVRAQKDLILLYNEETFTKPTETIEWLNARRWISCHHHVRCPRRVFKRRLLSERYGEDSNYEGPSRMSDFARLARVLTGTSVGLVLGGGGARGIAHVGIIKKMLEAGIPIDSVGGTSMGAFIGAIYAEHGCIVKTTQRAREGCLKMASMWRKLLDMTYPYTSLFTGKAFNHEIESTFNETQIEDMLLPYFCITTDISSSKMKVHQTGCLWRYVRASMSLSGYLPPICDPEDGHLLLDGGYVNNLPADIMQSMGAKTIIAVDVGSRDENELTNYGDALSGFWMLWKKFNPFASPVHIPDMAGIQSRLAYVSCVRQLEEVKAADYCTYLRPPIDRFKTLQFGSFDEILEVGYTHGETVFTNLFCENAFPSSVKPKPDSSPKQKQQITVSSNTAPSFTDLTQLVAAVKAPNVPLSVLQKRARLFEYNSDDEDSEIDEVDFYREHIGGGTLSDQELLPEREYLSGPEEVGYESDTAKLSMRPKFQRFNSALN